MKVKTLVLVVLALGLVLAFAGTAQAQSACNAVSIDPLSGPPGSTVTVSGVANEGSTVKVDFDGTEVASAVGDQYDEFSVSFEVPAGASLGAGHEILVLLYSAETECPFDFTVVAAAETAPAATAPATTLPAALPNTGFILIPAGALVAGGAGSLLYSRRRRR